MSDKLTNVSRITLESNEKAISDDQQLSKAFYNFFQDALRTLGLDSDVEKSDCLEFNYRVENAARIKHKGHSTIKKVNEFINATFYFRAIEPVDVEKEIQCLNGFEVGSFQNILTKCLKEVSNLCSSFRSRQCNKELVFKKNFLKKFKLADATPVHKEEDLKLVKNYRPVFVLPTASTMFEKLMQ